VLEFGQRSELVELLVGDTAETDVQESQARELADILEDAAGDLGAAQIQVLESAPVLQVSDAGVTDVFGVVEVEPFDVPEGTQVLQPDIGDPGVGEANLLELRQAAKLFEVRVRDPGERQVDAGDLAGLVSPDTASFALDPGGCVLGGAEDAPGSQQQHEQSWHLSSASGSEGPSRGPR